MALESHRIILSVNHMSNNISTPFSSLLEAPPLSRIRRNHGLEHATLHMLAERCPGKPLVGHSDLGGFWILGDIPAADMDAAVQEALARLNAGEHGLAVHPFCGTNLAAAGVLAGTAATLAMLGVGKRLRDKLERLPLAIILASLGLMVAQPMGLLLQQHVTTSGYPQTLRVVKITPTQRGNVRAYRVLTEG
jgi:Domain of unknown function (DUF6391)